MNEPATHGRHDDRAARCTAVAQLYVELDRRIADHHPVCRNRGVCCKFGAYGHRLMVTPLELDYFRSRHPDVPVPTGSPPAGAAAATVLPVLHESAAATCPYQIDGMCSTRHGRPLGCRVFFCESVNEGWQEPLTEWALARLRRLHDLHGITYRYQEWLSALADAT